MRQGICLTDEEVKHVIDLLATTDLPVAKIAKRMDCGTSVVIKINRKYGVRNYAGRRATWQVGGCPNTSSIWL